VVEEPIAITGLGVLLPGANSIDEFWSRLTKRESQIREISRFDAVAENLPVFVAGQIAKFDYRNYLPCLPERHAQKYSREILATVATNCMAWQNSGLSLGAIDPRRVSIVQSSSRGSSEWWLTTQPDSTRYRNAGAMFQGLPSSAASLSAISIGARGPAVTVTGACVGGHHALGVAANELRAEHSDAVIVGGREFPITPGVMRCFLALGDGVLTSRSENPGSAIRPYSIDRDGMALGEGAIAICLERYTDALRRNARIYALMLSQRSHTDGAHATTMDMTGKQTALLIREALEAARIPADRVGYFCGHGTATKNNDIAECRALRELYADDCLDEKLPPIGSNKPIFGHTLGVAGLVNVAATALMFHHQQLVPTANVGALDPECTNDHVIEGVRDTNLEYAVSLAFAFGAQTAVVTMGRA
jgi:3-oxoacyl-[acyl-carrier-protein] synthase II